MKHLKKTLAMLLAAACAFTLLSGFHGRQDLEAFVLPDEFDESRDYEISFWAKNDTNKTQVDIYLKAIEDFEELYPNIHVTMRRFTDYKVIYNDVITNIPTLTTPNVCISYPDHIATYITGRNVVVPLDDLINDPKYGLGGSELKFDGPDKEEIIKKFFDECLLGGVTYAVPYMRSTEALYINKTYVEAMGFTVPDVPTWDWIWEVSEAALEMNEDGTYKVNGQSIMIPFIYKSTDNQMITMLKQKGAGYTKDDGTIEMFSDTAKELLYTIYDHAATGAFSTFGIKSYPGNYLNAGQCIFGIDSTAGATWMGSGAGHQDISEDLIVDFETVVRPIPQFDAKAPCMISQGPSICIFNKEDPQEVLASWLFTQFMLTNDVQIAYSQTEGYIPVTSKAQQDPAYLEYLSRSGEDNDLYYRVKIDAAKLTMEYTDDTFITPVFNGSASVRNAAGSMIEEAAYAPIRKLTVDDAYMEDLFSRMQKQYKLDQVGTSVSGKKELGELPKTAKMLLGGLAAAWVCIAIYAAAKYNKKVKRAE